MWWIDPSTGTRMWADALNTAVAETDDELRARLLYVAGDCERNVRRIQGAAGIELDAIADEYQLRRRIA